MPTHHISLQKIDFSTVEKIITENHQLALSKEAVEKIQACRNYLDQKMASQKTPVYGINTGFGALYDKSISESDLGKLQYNLVVSHACGMGDEVPSEIVKLMLLLKIQALSYGNSGVQLLTVQRLVDFFNHDIMPVVYQQGSLGASGDLAPLAHLCLPLLGLGEVYYKGEKQTTEQVYKKLGWKPISLQSKEGLALLNGTQFMSAYGVWCLTKSLKLSTLCDVVGAISLEAYDGRIEPFNDLIHQIRPHKGQIKTAALFRKLLQDSQLISQPKKHVQDPYSFRCIPQVHGASKDAIEYVASVFLTEINSVTDNPTAFPEEDLIISA
jgi:histidine ammonia-lyase